MTSTIQFWMNLTLQNKLPKMDDHIHPTLDDYCSFRSLYKKFVSFSSKFGRISHVRIKLPKVEENRSIIFFHYWKRNIPRLFKINFRGFRRFLIHGNSSHVVLYTQCLRYNICSTWFLDIRISTCLLYY